MTVKINGYEVEIKAKGIFDKNRFNKMDTEELVKSLFDDYRMLERHMVKNGENNRLTDTYHQNCEAICSVLIEAGHSYREF